MDIPEDDLQMIAKGVQKFINEDKNLSVISNLMNFTREQIHYIVNHKVNGKSCLIVATQMGNIEIVKFLVEDCLVDLEQTGLTRVNGKFVEATPLWIAVKSNQNKVAAYLIGKGADINTSGSKTPLIHEACGDDNALLVLFLIENGADVNLQDKDGKYCIQKALDKPEVLRCLVSNGADTSIRCGKRPLLHTAIQRELVEAVDILVDGGADIYEVDFEKTTALQYACINFRTEMVEHMMSKLDLPRKTIIETYELLGAAALENKAIDKVNCGGKR